MPENDQHRLDTHLNQTLPRNQDGTINTSAEFGARATHPRRDHLSTEVHYPGATSNAEPPRDVWRLH